MLDWLILPAALFVGFVLLIGFFVYIASMYGLSSGRSPITRSEAKPKNDTFTNEEILTYGVDVRSKHARNQLKFSKYASDHGMTPAQQINRFLGEAENRRRDEVVKLDTNNRKRLKG